MKIAVPLFALFFFSINIAWSADSDGKFAAKGAGRKSCSEFMQAKDAMSRDYFLFGGWLEGYLTAYNKYQQDNYDVTPWQTTELMLSMIEHHCKTHPDSRILSVTDGLLAALVPARLNKESQVMQIDVAGHSSYYYTSIILQIKTRLQQLGFYQGDISSSRYAGPEIVAMRDFQKAAGLKQTGIPDQYTLVRLFLRLKK